MRTFTRQDAQIRESVLYDDTITPSEANFETNASSIEYDLNSLRSQASNILDGQAGNWFGDLNIPSTLDTGSKRGVNDLNTDLHAVEKKRVLRNVYTLPDITVGGSDNFAVLGSGELPPNTTAAVGAVTTLGTVAAFHAGTFGTHSMDEVAGSNALRPKNLCIVDDGDSKDPLFSGGQRIWGLLQTEIVTDGHTINTSTQQAQVSFVIYNTTGDDLILCPAVDIQGQKVNVTYRERVRYEDLNEQDFLSDGIVEVPGASVGDLQTAYDNQGTTAVNTTTNSTLDLEGAGLAWRIRDDLEANLFGVVEGSAGGTSKVEINAGVDTFDVDAAVNDFLHGISVDTGAAGTTMDLGVTAANTLTSGGDLKLAATSDLRMTDQFEPGGWSLDGIALSDAAQEWTDFEANFGEVSLMDAVNQAYSNSGRAKGYGILTSDVAADTDIALTTAGNLDADLPDYSGVGAFVDDCDVFLNGEMVRTGADASANHDVYPGTTPSVGMLKFEYPLIGTGSKPDQLSMIVHNN